MVRQKEYANYRLGSMLVALWHRYMDELTNMSTHAQLSPSSVYTPAYSVIGPVSGTLKSKVEYVQSIAIDTLGTAMSCYR